MNDDGLTSNLRLVVQCMHVGRTLIVFVYIHITAHCMLGGEKIQHFELFHLGLKFSSPKVTVQTLFWEPIDLKNNWGQFIYRYFLFDPLPVF